MSHNTLKLNTNSFDVNSNQTASVDSLEFCYCMTGNTPSTYPFTPTAGQPYVIYRGQVINNITGLNLIDHPSHTNWIQKYEFTSDGVYKIAVFAGLAHDTLVSSNHQTYQLINESVNPVKYWSGRIGRKYNDSTRPTRDSLCSIVEVSGSSVTINIRQVHASGNWNLPRTVWNRSHIYIERLE